MLKGIHLDDPLALPVHSDSVKDSRAKECFLPRTLRTYLAKRLASSSGVSIFVEKSILLTPGREQGSRSI